MLLQNNSNLSSQSQIHFGYGKGTRELVKSIYPYCALTGQKYGKGPLNITTDHILPHHHGGASRDFNYLFITARENSAKKCTSLQKIVSRNPEYIKNLEKYFEALLNSGNSMAKKYAERALDTVLGELSGIQTNLLLIKSRIQSIINQ